MSAVNTIDSKLTNWGRYNMTGVGVDPAAVKWYHTKGEEFADALADALEPYTCTSWGGRRVGITSLAEGTIEVEAHVGAPKNNHLGVKKPHAKFDKVCRALGALHGVRYIDYHPSEKGWCDLYFEVVSVGHVVKVNGNPVMVADDRNTGAELAKGLRKCLLGVKVTIERVVGREAVESAANVAVNSPYYDTAVSILENPTVSL